MLDIFTYFIYVSLLTSVVFFLMLRIRFNNNGLSLKLLCCDSSDIDFSSNPTDLN